MPVTVERLGNESILIATFSGNVDVPTMENLFQQSDQLAKQMPGHIYRINDFRNSSSTFSDIVAMTRRVAELYPNRSVPSNLTIVYVTTGQMEKLFADLMRQRHGTGFQTPIFKTMESALDYVRTEIKYKENVR